MTTNKTVLAWIVDAVALCKPDHLLWIDGSEAQDQMLRKQGLATGELIELNQELLPGCVLHRSDVNDVARVEGRTYICSRKEEDAGPTNNWMDPKEAYPMLTKLYDGCMKGRTMYVVPFSMGPLGSPIAHIGVELTDSAYVAVNQR
ncbi:MAG: phosphoenolpyruvate carboxykinase, partial [Oscillospiraceae bacterium]